MAKANTDAPRYYFSQAMVTPYDLLLSTVRHFDNTAMCYNFTWTMVRPCDFLPAMAKLCCHMPRLYNLQRTMTRPYKLLTSTTGPFGHAMRYTDLT